MTSVLKEDPVVLFCYNLVVDVGEPQSLTYAWNGGSLIGAFLAVQLVTGIFLSMSYTSELSSAFSSTWHITRDMSWGWLLRSFHATGASFFFAFIFFHVGRGLYFRSFRILFAWTSGVILFLLSMIICFLGYVLPWGQMSYWGATVITNFFSAIPIFGQTLVIWLWGGYSVSGPTLSRFFSFHFLFPFVVLMIVVFHIIFFHQVGSSSSTRAVSVEMLPFHPYFIWKDVFGMMFFFLIYFFICFIFPDLLSEPQNFIPANPLVTPTHIQPEWYFLFAYAILRSVPNKLGGVVAMCMAVFILLLPAFLSSGFTIKSKSHIVLFWLFVSSVLVLTWIGARPVEEPYVFIGVITTIFYFSYFLICSFQK